MKKLISSETVFSTKWFEIDALSIVGSTEPYYVVSTSDYVVIVALTNEKDLLFVKQYRPALNEQTIELPSGHVEDDQTPQEAAHAELFEETGHQAVKMELLGCVSPDPGR
jgi:ADP-ribose pyrophosphatase